MTNKKKYLFYPYSDRTYGVVKGLLLNNNYIDVIAPIGTGFVNKDIAYAVNRQEIGVVVKSSKEIDKIYDSIIISSYANYNLHKDEILWLLNHINKENLEIIYLGQDEKIKELLEPYKRYSLDEIRNIKEIEIMINRYNHLNLPLYKPKAPIVYIGGLLETIDSFDIGLQIKLNMEKLGYKVSMITKEMDGKIFGTIDYPKEFMSKNESVENQIISVNRLVQAVDYVEKPDIIFMEIPKGMMQYNDSFHNTFGIYCYMISQTLPPNYLILTIPQTILVKEYIEEIDKYLNNKIGKKIDILNITNAVYDIGIETTNTIDKPMYVLERNINKIILESKNNLDFELVNLNKNESIKVVVNDIIERFS